MPQLPPIPQSRTAKALDRREKVLPESVDDEEFLSLLRFQAAAKGAKSQAALSTEQRLALQAMPYDNYLS